MDESGELVRLPCKIGDTVYVIKGKTIHEATVDTITIDRTGILITASYSQFGIALFERFGERLFATREEAEAVLKEVQHGRIDCQSAG